MTRFILPILVCSTFFILLQFGAISQELNKLEPAYKIRKQYEYDNGEEKWELVRLTRYKHGYPSYDSVFKEGNPTVFVYQNTFFKPHSPSPKLVSRTIYQEPGKQHILTQFYGYDNELDYEYDNLNYGGYRVKTRHQVGDNKIVERKFNSSGLKDTTILRYWENGNIRYKKHAEIKGMASNTNFDSLGRKQNTNYYGSATNVFYKYHKIANNRIRVVKRSHMSGARNSSFDTTTWVCNEKGELKYPIRRTQSRSFYPNDLPKRYKNTHPHQEDSIDLFKYEYNKGYNQYVRNANNWDNSYMLERPFGKSPKSLNEEKLNRAQQFLNEFYLGYSIDTDQSFYETQGGTTTWFITGKRAKTIDFLVVNDKPEAYKLPNYFLERGIKPNSANILSVAFRDLNGDKKQDIFIIAHIDETEYRPYYKTLVYMYEERGEEYRFSEKKTKELSGVETYEEVLEKLDTKE